MSQALRQTSFRAIHGSDGGSYNEDAMAAMAVELTAAEADVPDHYNGRMLAWLRLRLGVETGDLPGLMAAFAIANGAGAWGGLGSFDPFDSVGVDALLLAGDAQSNGDRLLLAGDAQSNGDVLVLAGDAQG